MANTKVLIICGPTATGKSDLAVRLAKKFDGEIVSADSRQVYRGLNIGTAKITKREMKGVRHHMLDVASPRYQYSVARYLVQTTKVIRNILKRGKLPIICGGTGFYISALLGEQTLNEAPPNPRLRKQLAQKDAAELFSILKKLDPKRAKTIERQNPRRLIRAIEITKAKKINSEHKTKPTFETLKIGLLMSKEEIQKRIADRLDSRLKKGMLFEAKKLHNPPASKSLSWKRMEELGLEYRYMARFLQGKIGLREMVEKIKTESWHYSKRQMTWFKRDRKIRWFKFNNKICIEKSVKDFIKK